MRMAGCEYQLQVFRLVFQRPECRQEQFLFTGLFFLVVGSVRGFLVVSLPPFAGILVATAAALLVFGRIDGLVACAAISKGAEDRGRAQRERPEEGSGEHQGTIPYSMVIGLPRRLRSRVTFFESLSFW